MEYLKTLASTGGAVDETKQRSLDSLDNIMILACISLWNTCIELFVFHMHTNAHIQSNVEEGSRADMHPQVHVKRTCIEMDKRLQAIFQYDVIVVC